MLTSTLIVLLGSLTPAATPAPPPPRATTGASPIARNNLALADLSLGVLAVSYERVLGRVVSLHIALQYYRPWYTSKHVFGFGGELRAFFFLTHPAPRGLYLSPGFRVAYARARLDAGGVAQGVAWSPRLTVGWGFTIGKHFVLRFGAGAQYHVADLVAGTATPDFRGFYPVADIYVGARF